MGSGRIRTYSCAILLGVLLFAPGAARGEWLVFDDGSGLSATAEFVLADPSTLQITLRNTSTDPGDGSDTLLTSLAFRLPDGVSIHSGTALIGLGSHSVNFDHVIAQLEELADVSPEWGYGNEHNTGFGEMINFVSTLAAHTTPFVHVTNDNNLDGPKSLDGPQGGISAPGWEPGGLGGIEDSVYFELQLCGTLSSLSFLQWGAVVEFGSDYHFIWTEYIIPEPATMAFVTLGSIGVLWRRRRRSCMRRPPGHAAARRRRTAL